MKKQLLQRPAVGLTPAKPVFRKRRRLALAAERQARRRKSSTTWGPSRSDRSARAAALPLNIGHCGVYARRMEQRMPAACVERRWHKDEVAGAV